MDRTVQDRAQFLVVFERIIDFLRDRYVAYKEEQFRAHWPKSEDIHIQAQDSDLDTCQIDGRNILRLLQTLNLLNKFTHSQTRRVLGYSVSFRQRVLSVIPKEDDGDNVPILPMPKTRAGEIGSLGDCTRVLRFDTSTLGDPTFDINHFILALTSTAGSLRTIWLKCGSLHFTRLSIAESTFKTMVQCAPHLEELCFEDSYSGLLRRCLQASPGPFYVHDFASLRVVGLNNCPMHDLVMMDHGLPPELSPLHSITSLRTIHLHNPYKHAGAGVHETDIALSVSKVSWTREVGSDDFGLESARVSVQRNYETDTVPAHVCELLKRARHLIFEAAYASAAVTAATASIVFPIWSTLDSLSIITDDFPSGFMRRLPSSIGTLKICFRVFSCRLAPSFLDDKVLNLLKSRNTKNVQISVSARQATPLEKSFVKPFVVHDENFL